MVSYEEKRWIVVGIAMNKVAAPVLRDAVKQGMDTNYANLDRHCQVLHPPCTLKTLTHGVVRADPIFGRLKFQNINNNDHLYGKCCRSYNFSINGSVDLAKLYLPDYEAQFSAFDDSLDMNAILHLLSFKNYVPAAVFSPHIQASADDVRENIRNKWGYVDVTEWTDALFDDCFDKLKALVRSLGLTTVVENNTLDQLADWQTKGCHLVMGHAVDKELQQEVRVLIKNIRSGMRLKNKKNCEIEEDVAILKDESSCKRARLDAHDEHLYAVEEKVQEVLESSSGEMEKVLERLVSFEGELSKRLLAVEEGLAKTDGRVEIMERSQTKVVGEVDLLKQRQTETLGKVDQLEQFQTSEVERLKRSNVKTVGEVEMSKQNHSEAAAIVDQLKQRCAKTDEKVEQMELNVKNWLTQTGKPDATFVKAFDLTTCRSKVGDHYIKTSTVPTSVWCQKAVKNINEIFTRLSFVKDPGKNPAGTTQSELKHYCDLFTANKDGSIPKRILVQGQTGIGKSTFVKKLLVDWVEVNKGAGEERVAVLKNFELVVAVNLKEVSNGQSLIDVIRMSNVFAKEDKYMTEGLVDYITNNQEKVLLIFDGYDEYRCGCDSELYEIFVGNSLRSCCVLITTRISKADELRGKEDLLVEITGFSKRDRALFMRRFFCDFDVRSLESQLLRRKLDELAKFPLLLLFFCTLWKNRKPEHFPETKTKLYMDIIEFVLNHSHIEQPSPRYVEVTYFKDILAEIGKVALQGLLNDEHLFEYSLLSDSIRCNESTFIGLLQITEYSGTLRPVGMVSFVHKSIQEFLAAWYITYKCIPEGRNLSEIGVKLDDYWALENVFQFMCGLSKDGALLTLNHLKSVRISDPSLDLSKAIPDVESEADVPLNDVTERQMNFVNLVLNAFEEVESKADLSGTCLDCLGTVLLSIERLLPKDLLLKAKDTNSWSLISQQGARRLTLQTNFVVFQLFKIVEILASESSKIRKIAEFLEGFLKIQCLSFCGFFSVLCFRNGQVYFYITHLRLCCENHIRLFSGIVVPSPSVHLNSRQLCLKFLKSFACADSKLFMESLGAVISHCNHLKSIEVSRSNDSLSHFLWRVPNHLRCSFVITFCCLTSKGAVEHAYLLPSFEIHFRILLLDECSAEAATRLLTAIKHHTLWKLDLKKVNLTSEGAVALGQSISEVSTLKILKISGLNEYSAEALTCLITAIKHKTLVELELSEMQLTSAAAEALCQLLPELSALKSLKISGLEGYSFQLDSLWRPWPTLELKGWNECSAGVLARLIDTIKHNIPEKLELFEIHLTSAVAEVLGQLLFELPALQTLTIWGLTGYSAEAVKILVAAIKHKTLKELVLSVKQHLTSAGAEALGQSLPELSALQTLKIRSLTGCSDGSVTRLFSSIQHKTLKDLELSKINLTPALAEALGKLLPHLPALQGLRISGSDGCSLKRKEMEALFGRFNRPSSLNNLWITCFNARGSLAPLTQNLCFFPCLLVLGLENLDLGEGDLSNLLENLKFTPKLHSLYLMGNPVGHAVRLMIPYLLEQPRLERVIIGEKECSKEDLDYVQKAVKKEGPWLSIGEQERKYPCFS